MCLILVAWRSHPRYPCVVAANRDEYFGRPTAEADWWEEPGEILAGRDLQAGGTWLGVTRTGRFSALTNFRDPSVVKPDAPSRGALVTGFLTSRASTAEGLEEIARRGAQCNPFNVLCSDGQDLGVYESTTGAGRILDPGVYALSNHLLDTPWPKVTQAKSRLARSAQRSAPVGGHARPAHGIPSRRSMRSCRGPESVWSSNACSRAHSCGARTTVRAVQRS